MKIRTLVAATLVAAFATTTASAAKLELEVNNESDGAIAVGDATLSAWANNGRRGFDATAGGRAIAGSVKVDINRCGCGKAKVEINNEGAGSIAVGQATAGSTMVTLY